MARKLPNGRQLVVAGAIIVLAALLAVSISLLRRQADSARQVQINAEDLSADAERVSRIEWQATAERGLSPDLRREFGSLKTSLHASLDAFRRAEPTTGPRLNAEGGRYLAAVTKELALLDAGRTAESMQFDQREVDPAFDQLQRRLDRIESIERLEASTAATATDLGVSASLLLAGLGLIVALWRLDALRGAAARIREQDLEFQALHDVLTGLPNRRKLLLDLEGEVLRAKTGSRCVVVLCDLDGFKGYNDSFGHLEGDLLLARLGEELARKVAPYGTAYRFGGDEFCALLRVDDYHLESALGACRAALSESGSGFDVRVSIGAVKLPQEAADAATAMRLADHRMYEQKNTKDSSAKQQLRDLIMRVHIEQDPRLHEHVHDVAGLAAGVGRELGLNELQVADLVRAAELHDVGKIAIPDSILQKPESLDPREEEFMRRHTLIGESILSAGPALAGVGQLVRSSHERYDGAGYPDGLRGAEIPLASRIVFVCDAFAAMTADRPYREGMGEEVAVAELERCAGTQFDPVVVDAFVAELAARQADRDGPLTPAPAGV
jgi:diguanylate cyclase (GGDEF)-like protein